MQALNNIPTTQFVSLVITYIDAHHEQQSYTAQFMSLILLNIDADPEQRSYNTIFVFDPDEY